MKRTQSRAVGPWPVLGLGLFSVLCAALLAASAGGDYEIVPSITHAASDAARSAASVQPVGCVVDESCVPRTGGGARTLSADGRLIGQATSDKNGLFRLQAPAWRSVSVVLEWPGGEALVVATGPRLSASRFLRDPRD